MHSNQPNRVPAGVPAGGQFDRKQRSESGRSLNEISARYVDPPPGSAPGGPGSPWALRTYKWPASDWVPDVDGYMTDDGFHGKPCWLSPGPGERRAGWAVSGPGRDIPVHADSREDARLWMKRLQDSYYRDLEAQKWPSTGKGRFESTSSVRRDHARKLREGSDPFRLEMRAALSHLLKFKEGDTVVWTDEESRTREGVIGRGGRSDGRFGSWESYGVHVTCRRGDGSSTTTIDCHHLATGRAGLRKSDVVADS